MNIIELAMRKVLPSGIKAMADRVPKRLPAYDKTVREAMTEAKQ